MTASRSTRRTFVGITLALTGLVASVAVAARGQRGGYYGLDQGPVTFTKN